MASLQAHIGADTSDLQSGLSKAQSSLEQTQGAFSKAGAGAVAMGNLLGGAVTSAINGVTNAVGSLYSGMISGNAQFETYETQFGVLLKSTSAAKDRLAELAQFGASTPFDLPQVVEADKILQGFGLHSEEAAKKFGFSGTQIRTIAGDVASGTGASFSEIAGYLGKFASGATGEAISRFQELGIVTREQLTQMGIQFDKSGSLVSPLPQAMSAVLQNMQGKFGGMMSTQSSTFAGMKSNMEDWVAGALRTMGAPIFDKLKDGMAGVLTVLNSDAVKSAMDGIASSIASGIGSAIDALAPLGSALANAFSAFQASGVAGGVGNLLASMGLDSDIAEQISDKILDIQGAIQSAKAKLDNAIATFQIVQSSGGGTGNAVAGFLFSLGIPPELAANVGVAIENVIGVVTEAKNRIATAISSFRSGLAAGAPGSAVAGFLASLGVSEELAGQVGAGVANIISAVNTAKTKLLTAIDAFKQGWAAGPGVATINALTALGVSEELAGKIGTGVATVINAVTEAKNKLMTAIEAFKSGFATGGAGGGASAFLVALGISPDIVAQISSTIGNVVSAVQDGIARIQAAIVSAQSGGGVEGVLQALGLSSETISAIQQVGTLIANAASSIASHFMEGLAGAAQALAPIQGPLHELMGLLGELAQIVGVVVMGALIGLAGFVSGALPGMAQMFVGAVTTIDGVLGFLVDLVKGTVSIITNLIHGDWAGAWEAAGKLVADLSGRVGEIVHGLEETVIGAMNALVGGVVGAFQTLYETVTGQKLPAFKADVIAFFNGLRESVTSIDWGSVGSGIIDGIKNGVTSAASSLASSVANAARSALDAAKSALGIQSPSTVAAQQIGVPIGQGIGVGIQQGVSGIDIGAMLRALFGNIPNIENVARSMGAIKEALSSLGEVIDLSKKLWQAGQSIDVNGIANLMFKIHDIVMAAGPARGDIGDEIVGPFQRLADSFGHILAAITTLGDLVKKISELGASITPSAIDGLSSLLTGITAAATRMVVAAAPATAAVNAVNTSGLPPLNDALQALSGVIDNTVSLVTQLLDERGGRVAWATAAQRVGQQIVDLAVSLTTFGVRLVNAAGPATAALNAVPDKLKDLVTGIQGVDSLIGNVGSAVTSLLDLRGGRVAWAINAVRVGQEIVDLFGDLAAFGVRLVNAAAPATTNLSAAAAALGPLSQALQTLEPLFASTVSLVTFILDGIKRGIPTIDVNIATELFIKPLIRMGLGLAQGAVQAVGTTVLASEALDGIKGVLSGLTDIFTDTIDLVGYIFTALKHGIPTIDVPLTIQLFIGPLIRLGLGLATGAAQAAGAVVLADAALNGIAGVLSGLTDIFTDVRDLIAYIFTGLKNGLPTIDVPMTTELFIGPLIRLAQGLAQGAALAAGETVLASAALDSIGSALSGLIDIFDDTRSLITYIFDGLKAGLPTIDVPMTIELFIGPLVRLAQGLAAGAVQAAGETVLATEPLGSIGTALGNMLGVIEQVLDVFEMMTSLIENPVNLPSPAVAIIAFLPLVRWGQVVAQQLALAVGPIVLATENAGDVGSVLGSMLGAVKSVLDILKMTVSLVENPVNLPSPAQAVIAFLPLVRWGQVVAQQLALATGSVILATENAGDVGSVLGSMLGAVKQVVDVGAQITSLMENPVSLPTPAVAIALIQPLIDWAQQVAVSVAQATGLVTIAENSLSEMGSTLGDVIGVIENGLKLPDLIKALTTFQGINFTIYGPKLDLLIDSLKELLQRFALRAQGANFTEAAQKAVAAFSTGAGQAIDTLTKGFDFAQKIADSVNLHLPAGPQIDTLLAPIFALIDSVTAAFVAHAGDVDAEQIAAVEAYANGVKAFFETIQTAIEAVQSAAGLHIESSGFNNIRALLANLFDMFSDFSPNADAVNAVTAAISSMLGGIANMVAGSGTASGQSWVSSFVAAIASGAPSIQAAIAAAVGGSGGGPSAPGSAGGAGSGMGGGVINNTYNTSTKNFNISVVNQDSGAAATTNAGLVGLTLF